MMMVDGTMAVTTICRSLSVSLPHSVAHIEAKSNTFKNMNQKEQNKSKIPSCVGISIEKWNCNARALRQIIHVFRAQ